ncbi:MaoC/PaaZ C-terminal domain-containing protein [Novosphingobium resinovorum]
MTGTASVVSLTDRGEGRGAVLVLEREISNADTDAVHCRLRQTLLLRGDGGFGGPEAPREAKFEPVGAPDAVGHYAISPRAALIYRLSGDWNPLHLDPGFAAKAGFPRPILHGLASYAVAAWRFRVRWGVIRGGGGACLQVFGRGHARGRSHVRDMEGRRCLGAVPRVGWGSQGAG